MSKNRHHRKPRSKGGKTNKYNIAWLDKDRHALWHLLFRNMTGEEIMQDFNSSLIDPRFRIVPR